MILGNAVPTTVWSSATRNSASMSPATASTVSLRPDCSTRGAFSLIRALPLLNLHRLGEKPQHPPELLELFFAQDAVNPAPELVVDLRQPVQYRTPVVGQIHPHHTVVLRIPLPTDQPVTLQRLGRAGHARRVHLVLLRELALAQPVPPAQHREQKPLHAPDPGLPLYRRHEPLERQRERRQNRMYALENFCFLLLFCHRETSDQRFTEEVYDRSLQFQPLQLKAL